MHAKRVEACTQTRREKWRGGAEERANNRGEKGGGGGSQMGSWLTGKYQLPNQLYTEFPPLLKPFRGTWLTTMFTMQLSGGRGEGSDGIEFNTRGKYVGV